MEENNLYALFLLYVYVDEGAIKRNFMLILDNEEIRNKIKNYLLQYLHFEENTFPFVTYKD